MDIIPHLFAKLQFDAIFSHVFGIRFLPIASGKSPTGESDLHRVNRTNQTETATNKRFVHKIRPPDRSESRRRPSNMVRGINYHPQQFDGVLAQITQWIR